MMHRPLIRFGLFAALAAVALYPARGEAQDAKGVTPKTYVVQKGDDLPQVAEKLRPQQATTAQMGVALVEANRKVIWQNYDRGKRELRPGTKVVVPDDATVMKMAPETATREFSRMWRAEQHYRAALALEDSKQMYIAFVSYVEAAKLGHGLAQYRLGQLYDRDFSEFVAHDLQESAAWYSKARASEVQVPGQRARDVGAVGVPTH